MSVVAGAKNYALLMSWIINLLGPDRFCRLAHLDMRCLMNSSEGVAANSLGRFSTLIYVVTILDRYFGCSVSPIFMSTDLSLMGSRNVA